MAVSLLMGSTCVVANELKAKMVGAPHYYSQGSSAAPPSPAPRMKLSIRACAAHPAKSAIDSRQQKAKNVAITLAAVAFASGFLLSVGNSDASLVDDLLAKSAANKELNDKKRLATSGANVARAYTVTFGTCKFPENFTGCQDLAKTKNVKFLSEDLKLECEGKDKYKCGSNVFWKW